MIFYYNFFFLYFLLQSDDNASFLRAARGGNLEKVLEYLKANTDINTCNAVSILLHKNMHNGASSTQEWHFGRF